MVGLSVGNGQDSEGGRRPSEPTNKFMAKHDALILYKTFESLLSYEVNGTNIYLTGCTRMCTLLLNG